MSHNMVNFSPLAAEICWQVWAPQQILTGFASCFHYCSDIAHRRPSKLSGCLAISSAAALYIHFRGLLPPDRILLGAKFTLHPSLGFSYIGNVTARHSSSRRQPTFAAWYKEWNYQVLHGAPPIFSRAAITLGIGPHSSC